MANRFPLILNSGAGQIQELAASDNLDLTSSGIVNATSIGATSISVTGIATISGSIELGHASDTTLARSAPGVVTIEGVNIVTTSSTDNLTNKTLSSPTLTTPVLGAATATSLVVSGIVTANSYNVGTAVGISTTITTGITTTAATTIDSFVAATFRSARLQIQITQSTNYQASDILVIHNGTTASFVEYASIATNDYLGTLSVTVSGGNVLTQVAMTSATSATVKVLSQKITV